MRNELQKFNETVDILVKAYMNDTLEHGDCAYCAVGNLCAAAGYSQTDRDDWPTASSWAAVFFTAGLYQVRYPNSYSGLVKEVIDSTGYTWKELADIEYAFERAPGFSSNGKDEKWMFNGLMAVVDVLADIHGVDLEVKEAAKLMFV